jgi:transcriptional regulator with PAS, ATPase and Fis domain
MGKNISEIPQDVLDILMGYDWPGNVRELENVIERAVVLTTKETMIELSHLPDKLLEAHIEGGTLLPSRSYREAKQQAVDSFNKAFLERLLQMSNGNISQAARQAKMDSANFRRLIRKCGIQAEEHKQK